MLWRIRSCCTTTEQMAQMSEQLQQLSQQLSDQLEMLQQILETQKQQSRIQMETLINLGARQIAETTSDAREFQTKAFSEVRSVKGDENAGRVGCTSSALRLRDVSVKWLRSWIGLRTETIDRFPNQTFNKLLRRLCL